jgi:hypothetical protein
MKLILSADEILSPEQPCRLQGTRDLSTLPETAFGSGSHDTFHYAASTLFRAKAVTLDQGGILDRGIQGLGAAREGAGDCWDRRRCPGSRGNHHHRGTKLSSRGWAFADALTDIGR